MELIEKIKLLWLNEYSASVIATTLGIDTEDVNIIINDNIIDWCIQMVDELIPDVESSLFKEIMGEDW